MYRLDTLRVAPGIIRVLFALATLLLGVGCTGIRQGNEESPYYQVPVGSILHIRRTIEIPPGRTRVYLQLGRVTEARNLLDANCNIEVRRLDNLAAQHVTPGDYRVVEVERTEEEIAIRGPLQLAALGIQMADQDNGGTPWVYPGYRLWLSGPDPNVMRLSCRGAYASPDRALPPSIRDIRAALGEGIELELAAPN
jgi:hypothetical protein